MKIVAEDIGLSGLGNSHDCDRILTVPHADCCKRVKNPTRRPGTSWWKIVSTVFSALPCLNAQFPLRALWLFQKFRNPEMHKYTNNQRTKSLSLEWGEPEDNVLVYRENDLSRSEYILSTDHRPLIVCQLHGSPLIAKLCLPFKYIYSRFGYLDIRVLPNLESI